MYPENTVNPNTGKSRKPLIILAAIVVVLAIVVLTLLTNSSSNNGADNGPKGTLEISYNLPDDIGITVKLNGKTQKTAEKYTLTPGKYNLQVDRPGYSTFKSTVTVAENKDVLISVHMKPAEVPPADKPETLAPLLPPEISNPQITSAEYFYNRTWAVVHFNSDADNGDIAVMRFVPETQKWVLINEPGIIVDANQIGDAPEAVISYLQDNNLIFYGD